MRVDSFSDMPLRSQDSATLHQRNEAGLINSDIGSQKMKEIGEQQLDQLIEQGNRILQRLDTHLKWSVNKESNRMIVKVLDTQTNETIREIPPEKYLELVQNLCEQVGLFLDEKK